LNTGEVANLFNNEEKAELIEAMRSKVKEELNPTQMFQHFINTVK